MLARTFFLTPKVLNMQRKPSKVIGDIEAIIRANYEGNKTLRSVSRILEWAK